MDKYDCLVARIKAAETKADAYDLLEDAVSRKKITKGEFKCLLHLADIWFEMKKA